MFQIINKVFAFICQLFGGFGGNQYLCSAESICSSTTPRWTEATPPDSWSRYNRRSAILSNVLKSELRIINAVIRNNPSRRAYIRENKE